MENVIPMDSKLMRALKRMPGMAPFDEAETEYIKKIAKECQDKEINIEDAAEAVRERILEYRHQKRLRELEMAGVKVRENAVIESLRKRGLLKNKGGGS